MNATESPESGVFPATQSYGLTRDELDEIREYFKRLNRVFGSKSSLGPQLDHLAMGVNGINFQCRTEDALIDAIDECRDKWWVKMLRRMGSLSPTGYRVLNAYTCDTASISREVTLGVACMTAAAQSAYRTYVRKETSHGTAASELLDIRLWLILVRDTRHSNEKKVKLLRRISEQGLDLIASAVREYSDSCSIVGARSAA